MNSHEEQQIPLTLQPVHRGAIELLPLETIARIKDRRHSYRRCIEESPHTSDDVARYLNIEPAQFSRILNDAGRHLDDNKEIELERVCGFCVPTQYAAFQHGMELKKIRSSLEEENQVLRDEVAELKREMETLVKYGVLGRAKA